MPNKAHLSVIIFKQLSISIYSYFASHDIAALLAVLMLCKSRRITREEEYRSAANVRKTLMNVCKKTVPSAETPGEHNLLLQQMCLGQVQVLQKFHESTIHDLISGINYGLRQHSPRTGRADDVIGSGTIFVHILNMIKATLLSSAQ